MRQIKSERLKKLEQELSDLEQWLKLGLVPKKDIERHKEEIITVNAKIEEEKERLQFLKESGETEDFSAPKRQTRTAYTEMPTIPDIDLTDTAGDHGTDSSFELDTETHDTDHSSMDDRDDDGSSSDEDEDEESFFSERSRWRRGFKDIIDPEANEW